MNATQTEALEATEFEFTAPAPASDVSTLGSTMVEALEAGWREIQKVESGLPDVVIVLAPVSSNGKMNKFGHFAGMRWNAGGTNKVAEVLIAAEGLNRGGRGVFETLLHEAVHAWQSAHDEKGTSRQGRYHNRTFAKRAEKFGLVVKPHPSIGVTTPDVTDVTAAKYAKAIGEIDSACRSFRDVEQKNGGGSRNGVVLVCGCERKIRLSESCAEEGAIVCGSCQEEFLLEGARSAAGTSLPSDEDFLKALLGVASSASV